MKRFPFLNQQPSLILLRCSVSLIFVAHAVVRIINGSYIQFGLFLENKGFSYGTAIVWAITVFEIAGGILLSAGFFVQYLSAAFIVMLLAGIVLIHASLGWFVGEHGTGGMEYSFILIVCLIVIAASAKYKKSARLVSYKN